MLTEQEVAWYLECYDRILSGQIDAGQWRSDLGSGQSQQREGVENITQIMWPSELISDLHSSAAYQRALGIARQLLGDDMAFDFDMLIDKAPGTDTPTPFHQDMAYWVDLPDRRAVSCWIALPQRRGDALQPRQYHRRPPPGVDHQLPPGSHDPAGTRAGF